jgi:hypothetical protein
MVAVFESKTSATCNVHVTLFDFLVYKVFGEKVFYKLLSDKYLTDIPLVYGKVTRFS